MYVQKHNQWRCQEVMQTITRAGIPEVMQTITRAGTVIRGHDGDLATYVATLLRYVSASPYDCNQNFWCL